MAGSAGDVYIPQSRIYIRLANTQNHGSNEQLPQNPTSGKQAAIVNREFHSCEWNHSIQTSLRAYSRHSPIAFYHTQLPDKKTDISLHIQNSVRTQFIYPCTYTKNRKSQITKQSKTPPALSAHPPPTVPKKTIQSTGKKNPQNKQTHTAPPRPYKRNINQKETALDTHKEKEDILPSPPQYI
jgi:hypothetical protein